MKDMKQELQKLDKSLTLGNIENYFLGVLGVIGLIVGQTMDFGILSILSVCLCGITTYNLYQMHKANLSITEERSELAHTH